MHGRARLLGHPLHPVLVAFPVASYVFTFAALVAFTVTRAPFWYRVAMVANLVGVVTAVVAAVRASSISDRGYGAPLPPLPPLPLLPPLSPSLRRTA